MNVKAAVLMSITYLKALFASFACFDHLAVFYKQLKSLKQKLSLITRNFFSPQFIILTVILVTCYFYSIILWCK